MSHLGDSGTKNRMMAAAILKKTWTRLGVRQAQVVVMYWD
jgi:hypothetical protein